MGEERGRGKDNGRWEKREDERVRWEERETGAEWGEDTEVERYEGIGIGKD